MFETYEIATIVALIVLMVLLFVFMVIKAFYHFKYLKIKTPNKFEKYNSYQDLYNPNEFFNKYRLTLMFPFFSIQKEDFKDDNVLKIAKKVRLSCRLFYINLLILISFVIVLIVFFGEIS